MKNSGNNDLDMSGGQSKGTKSEFDQKESRERFHRSSSSFLYTLGELNDEATNTSNQHFKQKKELQCQAFADFYKSTESIIYELSLASINANSKIRLIKSITVQHLNNLYLALFNDGDAEEISDTTAKEYISKYRNNIDEKLLDITRELLKILG